MNQSTLITQPTITSNEDVIGDCLSEHLDLQHVGNDLFGFSVNVGVDQSDVIVTSDDVSEGRESFFDSLNRDGVGERVAEVLKFLIGRCRGYEESMSVTYR